VQLTKKKKLFLDYIFIERSEIEDTGEYDLEGLFIRLDHAIKSVGAKRVVLDTVESLFSGLPNENILRAELRRLFKWLKEKEVTAVITAERGAGSLTRHGLEEYVADCVIMLDHRVTEQLSTRRMRIVKYRGSVHGTNEYPFLIGESGISVMPITSLKLDYPAATKRMATGISGLDAMLGGKGFYRGSSVLVSGTAGTGKTSITIHIADQTCRKGEKCLYFAFEEAESQIIRNARSIGIDLGRWLKKGLLFFQSARPTLYGLETHLVSVHNLVDELKPEVTVFDPISSLLAIGSNPETQNMLVRILDFLKARCITSICASLTHEGKPLDQSEVHVSSIMDTWLLLRDLERGGERTKVMYILKSRGMAHSNQLREFRITNRGIELLETERCV
jgi:circadian clock protein KaiC